MTVSPEWAPFTDACKGLATKTACESVDSDSNTATNDCSFAAAGSSQITSCEACYTPAVLSFFAFLQFAAVGLCAKYCELQHFGLCTPWNYLDNSMELFCTVMCCPHRSSPHDT